MRVCLLALLFLSAVCCWCFAAGQSLNATIPSGFEAVFFARNLGGPRGILVVPSTGDILVVDASNGRVLLLHDADNSDSINATETITLAEAPGLNHGIALYLEKWLLASNMTTVFVWPFSASERQVTGNATAFIVDIPSGGHVTRSLAIRGGGSQQCDPAECCLYVQAGSGSNVDPDPARSLIRCFSLAALSGGDASAIAATDFGNGTVFAAGLRNTVGLVWHAPTQALWGSDEGPDNLQRADLGGDITEENPAEEINMFAVNDSGRFYGYPSCWSEGILPAAVAPVPQPGRQWAWPDNPANRSDDWCRNVSNNKPPVFTVQAHTTPLGITFYSSALNANSTSAAGRYAFPASMEGDVFLALHGSWDRVVPAGFKVVRAALTGDFAGLASNETVLASPTAAATSPDWPYRPSGITVGPQGDLLITSDATGDIISLRNVQGGA